jgi:uncharacterized protein YecE (DUF72 family)
MPPPEVSAALTQLHPGAFDRAGVAAAVADLANRGVYIGTSSWKYPGWVGQLYDQSNYLTRGKFSEKKFEKECLMEYARVFKTGCVDAAYYRFPDFSQLNGLMLSVPQDFRFAFKVTDTITIKRFSNQPRFGIRAGKANEDFLNPVMFTELFAKQFDLWSNKVGLFIFEFSRFYPSDYQHGRDFAADLDRFLEQIPKGWPYGVEMRNKHWLKPDYFDVLRKHGVAHIYNNWSEMPSVGEQMALAGSRTSDDLTGARFLLAPGRKYADSVKLFEPYDRVKEPNPEARKAGAALIAEGVRYEPRRKTYIYVNNRLEGNALETIARILEQVRPQ